MAQAHICSKFLDEMAELYLCRYSDGSVPLKLFSLSGEPLATPTVCLEEMGESPAPGNVFIKTWTENEGIYEGLRRAAVVGPELRRVIVNPWGSYAVECKLEIAE